MPITASITNKTSSQIKNRTKYKVCALITAIDDNGKEYNAIVTVRVYDCQYETMRHRYRFTPQGGQDKYPKEVFELMKDCVSEIVFAAREGYAALGGNDEKVTH